MKKEIHLFYLAKPRYGGWVSYTVHLYRSFMEMGYRVSLFCISSRDEEKVRPFSGGVCYQNVSLFTAENLVAHRPSLLTAVGKDFGDAASALVRAGASITIHDPTELHAENSSAIKASSKPIICIRKMMGSKLREQGLNSVFIPHPYIAPIFKKTDKSGAVAFSRLDWDKNTHVIAEGNQSLPPEKRVQIYGAENTLYTHHKIDDAFPKWRTDYKGKFDKGFTAAYELALKAQFVVDLSVISGDGGGTQYTFLEAWAAKSHLIVHRSWLNPSDTTVRDGTNCTAVGSPEELVKALSSKPSPKICSGGFSMLEKHAPKEIVPAYESAMKV